MVEKIFIGTGGWYDYKKDIVSPNLRLKAYAKKFNFVEVNATFYKILHPNTVERWRKLVPDDFQFSVKCYRALTHNIGIRPVGDAFKTMATMMSYCNILKAQILVLESPSSLLINDKFVKDAREFFSSLSLKNVRIAWEFRRMSQDLPDMLVKLLEDQNIIHAIDVSWEKARYDSDILYTRIFGNPSKGFTLGKEGIQQIRTSLGRTKSRIAYVSSHTPRMAEDAERLLQMVES